MRFLKSKLQREESAASSCKCVCVFFFFSTSLTMSLCTRVDFMHFYAWKFNPRCTSMPIVQDTQIYMHSNPLTRWATEDKRAADKSDHWCHLSSLSVSLSFFFVQTQKNTYLETLRHCHHCHDLMYWNVHFTSTENTGQYQSQKTDKPSNKDSIFDVWSHTEREKSQKQTATRH